MLYLTKRTRVLIVFSFVIGLLLIKIVIARLAGIERPSAWNEQLQSTCAKAHITDIAMTILGILIWEATNVLLLIPVMIALVILTRPTLVHRR